ncbi:hypothetical protein [Natrialba asiatica]|uniref:Uncharacterized protein n=1 Tax=Natrialba asiatica (strain ATCC 700177 / DSM 12278 / JCM 9576 / FERM P-10747 / NBRC 102637 / 172P1) TaxID=29540 RepID=M0AIA6_NATA1|nr:hypothetical protein [Natrialba asiatica]ELY97108.1 hypothetical protein C481_20996 [Natrialba asiatica DSM 12278]
MSDNERRDAINRYERTLDHQVALLDGIDEKAQKIVQYTGVVIGLVLTVVSLIPRVEGITFGDIPYSSQITFALGIFALLGAIAFGMITYLSSVIEYGLGGEFGHSVASGTVESPFYEEVVLNSYATAVESNREVININAVRFRRTLEFLITGIALLVLSGLYFLFQVPLWHEIGVGALYSLLLGQLLVYIHREEYLVLDRN